MEILFILLDKIRLLGVTFIDPEAFAEFIFRLFLNSLVLVLLVRWIYYSVTRRKDYLFTYILIGSIIFLLCYLLESVKLQLGFALGLFALFGIIRYRTSQIPIREMTYLFLVISLSMINALVNKKIGMVDVIFANLFVVGLAYGFEKRWLLKHESVKMVLFEKIDLIKPEKYDLLIKDLKERTGIDTIKRVEVGKIDFLHDTCQLKVYYEEKTLRINLTDNDYSKAGGDDDE
jgi:hypothetical protein